MKIIGVKMKSNGIVIAVYEQELWERSVFLKEGKIKSIVSNEGAESVEEWAKKYSDNFENIIKEADMVVIDEPLLGIKEWKWSIIVKYVTGKYKVKRIVKISPKEMGKFVLNKKYPFKSEFKEKLIEEFGIKGVSEDEAYAIWLVYLGSVLAVYENGERVIMEAYREKFIKSLIKSGN